MPFTYIRCEKEQENAITFLFNNVLEEMEKRQHYAFQITIYDANKEKEAKKIQQLLSELYSNTTINHVKINEPNMKVFGSDTLIITII